MPKTIHRWAYMPIFDPETGEYSWNKVKVVKVLVDLDNFNDIIVHYVLENCFRFTEKELFTEDKIDEMCPKKVLNYLVGRQLNRYPSQTIFSPFEENLCKGEKLDKLIEESKNIIDRLKRDDEILGEEYVLKIINQFENKKKKSK